MEIHFNTLEIRILLKCNEGALPKSDISRVYMRYPIKERKEALDNLMRRLYIIERELPGPKSKRIPLFYEITDKGRAWVKEYMATYYD